MSEDKVKKQSKKEQGPIEVAHIIKKLSLQEYQIIELHVQDGKVIKRVEREPNLSSVIMRNFVYEIGRE